MDSITPSYARVIQSDQLSDSRSFENSFLMSESNRLLKEMENVLNKGESCSKRLHVVQHLPAHSTGDDKPWLQILK